MDLFALIYSGYFPLVPREKVIIPRISSNSQAIYFILTIHEFVIQTFVKRFFLRVSEYATRI